MFHLFKMLQDIFQPNGYEEVPDWTDEDGCGLKTGGRKHLKLVDLSDVKYLIVSLQRLLKVNDQLKIDRTSVPVGISATIRDQKKRWEMFIPVAVIQHQGFVTGGESRGHYQADVSEDFKWYRYSDDSEPQPIVNPTDQGYIYLLKKNLTM